MTAFDFFDYAGTFAFAISGSLCAMRKRFDLVGIIVLAFATAIGGGSLRDMLIGRTPVGWMQNYSYSLVILLGALTAILFRTKLGYLRKTFFLFDSIGLATFTLVGVELGSQYGLNPLICIFLGTMSATFGGLIRDILSVRVPLILHKEIYASYSLLGGGLYLLLQQTSLQDGLIYLLLTMIILILRTLTVKYHWELPKFYKETDEEPVI